MDAAICSSFSLEIFFLCSIVVGCRAAYRLQVLHECHTFSTRNPLFFFHLGRRLMKSHHFSKILSVFVDFAFVFCRLLLVRSEARLDEA